MQKNCIMVNIVKVTELVRFDWFIKFMFRDKSDFDILEGFLSELLKEDIKILSILESEGNQSKKKDKFNRVDIMIKNSKGEHIIVEVQNNEEYDYLQRILYGTSKTIVENIAKGQAIEQGKIAIWNGKTWTTIADFTTVGYKRLLRFETVTCSKMRLIIVKAKTAKVHISELGVYKASPSE